MKLTYEQLEKSRNSWRRTAQGLSMFMGIVKGGDADRNLLISEIAKLSQWNAQHIEENDKLKLEIAELEQDLTGRTMSCVFCNNTAKERDEAIREREEVRAMMVTLCHRVVDADTREASDDDTN
jgi:regulator of replication initiation timing